MKTYDKQEQQKEQGRILVRRLARELTKEELNAVAGGSLGSFNFGMGGSSSSTTTCSLPGYDNGTCYDGGTDD